VTEELHGGEHGNTSVLELSELTLLELSGIKRGLARVEVSEVSPVVDGADQEDDLGPSKSRDGIKGGNTIGDIGTWDSRGDVEGESEEFGDDVSDNSELGNTSVFELSGAVLVEGGLVDVLGEAKRIEESGGGDDTELVLVSSGGGLGRDGRARGGLGSRGEGGGNTEITLTLTTAHSILESSTKASMIVEHGKHPSFGSQVSSLNVSWYLTQYQCLTQWGFRLSIT
jgi:hypothetical protein